MQSLQWKFEIIFCFCREESFLLSPHYQFLGVGQGMKHDYPYLWCHTTVFWYLCRSEQSVKIQVHENPAKSSNLPNMKQFDVVKTGFDWFHYVTEYDKNNYLCVIIYFRIYYSILWYSDVTSNFDIIFDSLGNSLMILPAFCIRQLWTSHSKPFTKTTTEKAI
jgi:hypothetical protein